MFMLRGVFYNELRDACSHIKDNFILILRLDTVVVAPVSLEIFDSNRSQNLH